MSTPNIPAGYHQVTPYIIVKDAQGFIRFMQNVFGAEERMRHMRDENTVQHAELNIGDSVIMCAEAVGEWQPNTAGLFIYVDGADAVYQKALAEGAQSVMEPSDQSYGRCAGVEDPFGNTWWITSVQQE